MSTKPTALLQAIEELANELATLVRTLSVSREDEQRIAEVIRRARELTASQPAGDAVRAFSLWSFLRSVLEQGRSIEMDYRAGNHKTYEEMSARVDAAARERADELQSALSAEKAKG